MPTSRVVVRDSEMMCGKHVSPCLDRVVTQRGAALKKAGFHHRAALCTHTGQVGEEPWDKFSVRGMLRKPVGAPNKEILHSGWKGDLRSSTLLQKSLGALPTPKAPSPAMHENSWGCLCREIPRPHPRRICFSEVRRWGQANSN